MKTNQTFSFSLNRTEIYIIFLTKPKLKLHSAHPSQASEFKQRRAITQTCQKMEKCVAVLYRTCFD